MAHGSRKKLQQQGSFWEGPTPSRRGMSKPECLSHLNSRLGIPRICVDPTHMRATPCSSTLSLPPPLHPLTQPSPTTHAYAYMPTHMRGTLTHFPFSPTSPSLTTHAYA
ncbi:hypothetical protein PIB30_059115 [Stylosanthes scabra]|uniref:Uncharacterized protein n=1 Tax=Stylosanthes scabra TaxID=79078 RepID=A0ABU6ZIU2_9FABA|nr:hypothetical protein [Stylosanthes scabra]